jgi:hypothetical protein
MTSFNDFKMFKLFFPVLIWFFFTTPCYSQLFDNTWLFGYDNNPDTTDKYGISIITFNTGIPIVKQNNMTPFSFGDSNCSISDSSGNLLFYSNAGWIGNNNNEIIPNSNVFKTNSYSFDGFVIPQYVVSIPYPGHENSYLILYQNYSYNNLF